MAPSNWVEAGQCPVSATIYATGVSGGAPSANLIRRLLMTGRAYPGQADLSAGDVYGLWNNRFINQTTHQWEANYELGDAPVGFLEHGDKQPVGN